MTPTTIATKSIDPSRCRRAIIALSVGLGLTWAGSPLYASPLAFSGLKRGLAEAAREALQLPALTTPTTDVEETLELLSEAPIARALRAEYAIAMHAGRSAPNVRPGGAVAGSAAELSPEVAHAVARTYAILAAPSDDAARRPPKTPFHLRIASLRDARRRTVEIRRTNYGPVPMPRAEVQGAIYEASAATGASAGYLWRTAQRESSFNPLAAAPTSSARGLFQFTEATWLETIGRYGARHGVAYEASLVRRDGRGRPVVHDPSQRRRLLALRFDARLSARLAGELTQANAAVLQSVLGRAPSDGELYTAHFLGRDGATRMLQTARHRPWTPAAAVLPDAAVANRSIFFGRGRAVTAGELIASLASYHG